MIVERLFVVFDANSDGYLSSEEFIRNLYIFFTNEINNKLKLVFRLYDFDNDGFISKEDVRLILSYVPITSSASAREKEGRFTCEGGGTEEFIDRAQSQYEIETLLNIYFTNIEKLDFQEYSTAVKEKASEIFLCVYSVLKSNLPSLAYLKRAKERSNKNSTRALQSPRKGYKLAVARTLDKFMPTSEIVKSSRKHLISHTTNSYKCLSERKYEPDTNESRETFTSNSNNIEELFCECGQPIEDFSRRLCKNCVSKRKGAKIEGYLIKPTRSKSKLGKFWIAIEYQEIYCYADKVTKNYKCVHSLLGCIVKEELPETKGKLRLYPFALYFSNKKIKKYYCMSKSHLEKWMIVLRRNTNHADIENYYIIKVFL